GADTIGALDSLGPDCALPQSPASKSFIVNVGTSPIDGDALAVGQQDAAPRAADSQIQTVKRALCCTGQGLHGLTNLAHLDVRQCRGTALLGGVKAMQVHGAAPRSLQRRAGGGAVTERAPDPVG